MTAKRKPKRRPEEVIYIDGKPHILSHIKQDLRVLLCEDIAYPDGLLTLTDDDVRLVLDAMPRDTARIAISTASKLKDDINAAVSMTNWRRVLYTVAVPLPPKIKELRKVQRAAEVVAKAFDDGGVHRAARSTLGDLSNAERQWLGCAECFDIETLIEGIRALPRLLEACEARHRALRDPHPKDMERYYFIAELARVYEAAFGQTPPGTREGPWCTFLTEVLCRCEGKVAKKVEPKDPNSAAQSIWLEVRKHVVEPLEALEARRTPERDERDWLRLVSEMRALRLRDLLLLEAPPVMRPSSN
jgi:hypothetical protein